MTIEELSIVITMIIVFISFGMSIYSLHLQRTDLKLQRREVTSQNKKMIQLLKRIAGGVGK